MRSYSIYLIRFSLSWQCHQNQLSAVRRERVRVSVEQHCKYLRFFHFVLSLNQAILHSDWLRRYMESSVGLKCPDIFILSAILQETQIQSKKMSTSTMGDLAHGSAHARTSARPPIDTSGNFPAHMSAESPSNISPNPSEVISEVSEP